MKFAPSSSIAVCLALLPILARAEVPLPDPELGALEAGVEARLRTARQALLSALEDPGSDARERSRLYGHTGRVFHAHQVFTVAEACYLNARELDPKEPLWPYLLGFLYEDTARFPKAATEYERVLELDAGHALATLRLGRVYLELGEIERAEPLLRQMLEQEDLAAPVHAALGKIAAAREQHADAARHYEAALAAQPQASQLHYPLAVAYRRLGEVEKARQHAALGGAAKIAVPDSILDEVGSLSVSSQMFLTLGAQALQAGRFDLAKQALRGAIAVNPENQRAHLNLAVVLIEEGDLDAAEDSVREALRLDPEYGFAYLNLGIVYDARGQIADARAAYEKALEKAPGNLKAHFRLANGLMRTGEYDKAARHYRAAVEIAPSFVQARYLESLALIALRRYPAAREALEEAVKIHPENQDFTRALARLLATSDPLTEEDGARALSYARALDRDNPENVETLAMALAATGHFAEAVATQRTLLEAARGRADAPFVRHLEYNLERYGQGRPSDRPWAAEAPAATDSVNG